MSCGLNGIFFVTNCFDLFSPLQQNDKGFIGGAFTLLPCNPSKITKSLKLKWGADALKRFITAGSFACVRMLQRWSMRILLAALAIVWKRGISDMKREKRFCAASEETKTGEVYTIEALTKAASKQTKTDAQSVFLCG